MEASGVQGSSPRTQMNRVLGARSIFDEPAMRRSPPQSFFIKFGELKRADAKREEKKREG